jgi:hypothetical protein
VQTSLAKKCSNVRYSKQVDSNGLVCWKGQEVHRACYARAHPPSWREACVYVCVCVCVCVFVCVDTHAQDRGFPVKASTANLNK